MRRCRFELKEAEARCHILEGLIIGVHNVDEVVKIIKTSESTADARRRLMERFALSEKQAQAILDLRLARLAKLEVTKLEQELEALKKRIAELKRIIADRNLQFDIVKKEMLAIKQKYKCERKTRIVESEEKNQRKAQRHKAACGKLGGVHYRGEHAEIFGTGGFCRALEEENLCHGKPFAIA